MHFAKSLVSVVVVIDILMASIFLRFCLSVHYLVKKKNFMSSNSVNTFTSD